MQAVGCVESSDLLVLDDQSLARRIADISDELLYAIVHQRYNLRRAIVITSNLLVQDLSKYLADVTMATTILDRLIHRCSTLGFEGKSYRLKQSASRIAIAPEQSEFERPC
ncbi:istB-like ATP binding family protein [Hydrogenophaga sp. RAC07]|nr:istB-like ATP binding family protein [Hydrogenophaga sp. RAC07]